MGEDWASLQEEYRVCLILSAEWEVRVFDTNRLDRSVH